ncbi:MAG: nodulation protein NfeD [Armatimonadota bacterium]
MTASAAAAGEVYVLTYRGTINPASADYILRGIQLAEKESAECVVLRLNTPGGLVSTTRRIVEALLATRVPVATYVWPSGGHAASAGTFIVMAGHVAAMAPATNIGAAHPIFMGQGQEGAEHMLKTMTDKATNDAVAFIKGIAKERNRNAEWAESAVRESAAISAEDAVEQRVVDFVAGSLEELLTLMDGRSVETPAGEKILNTKDAATRIVSMTAREKVFAVLAVPEVAYILMMLALLGIILEINAPGLGGGGILSGICMILALYGLSVLQVNYAGVALILLGAVFLILEIKVASHGLLTIGGVASLAIGSFMLFDVRSVPAFLALSVPTPVIVVTVVCVTGFFLFCVYFAVKGHKRRVVTGREALVGMVGVARSDIREEGRVFADSTLWTAESVEGVIPAGAKVEVVGVDGLRLKVRSCAGPGPVPEEVRRRASNVSRTMGGHFRRRFLRADPGERDQDRPGVRAGCHLPTWTPPGRQGPRVVLHHPDH